MADDAKKPSAVAAKGNATDQAVPTYDQLAYPDTESRELREDDPTAMKDPST